MHIFVLCAHFVTHSVLRLDKKSPFTELQSEEVQDLSNMEPKTLFFLFYKKGLPCLSELFLC